MVQYIKVFYEAGSSRRVLLLAFAALAILLANTPLSHFYFDFLDLR